MRVVAVPCLKDNFAYLVIDGTRAAVVDPSEAPPIEAACAREGVTLAAIWLTHHHWDHVYGMEDMAKRFDVPIVASAATAELLDGKVDETFAEGGVLESGGLKIEPLATPGHCGDHHALLIDGSDCLTADVLFHGTVGGTRAPGATGFADLKSSILDKLMGLDHSVRVHPGAFACL